MNVSSEIWWISIAVTLGFIVLDFYSHARRPHVPSVRESAFWSIFYIGMACVFGAFLWASWPGAQDPHQYGLEFFAGYITEKSLSVDNLFVFALIFTSFAVPRQYQQKLLLFGIALALILRTVLILAGASMIDRWSWVFYIFGAFLLYTAIGVIREELSNDEPKDPHDLAIVKIVNKIVPVSTSFDGGKLTTRVNGKLMITPLAVAFVAIGFTDVLFALDSIPAIYGLTNEAYIVFTANALALLGLRQLFFLLDGLLEKLEYLPYGLAFILGFIGYKLIAHALETNTLSFVNNGNPIHIWGPSTVVSLIVIVVSLLITAALSLVLNSDEDQQQPSR